MATSRNKSKVSTVALVLVLTFAAALITCVPAVNANAIEPPTALLWAMLNSTVIVQLLISEFFSPMPVRASSAFLF